MRSNNNIKAGAAAVEPNPRLIMAVIALGMIAGALLTSPNKPGGPAADLAQAKAPTELASSAR
jgi:hypothetical protein